MNQVKRDRSISEHVPVKRRKKYRLRFKFNILTLVLVLFTASVVYHIILGLFGLAVNYRRLAEQTKRLEELNRRKAALELEKMRWQSEEVLEKEARKLGMVKDGEIKNLITLPAPEDASTKDSPSKNSTPKN